MRVISQYIANNNNAGPKAKVDIEKILNDNYGAEIFTYKIDPSSKKGILTKIRKFLFSYNAFHTKDLVLVQLPYTNKLYIIKKAKNKIAIIHDIDGLRYQNNDLLKQEIKALNNYKCVIVHNKSMKAFLNANGLKVKTVELDLFDYLINSKIEFNKSILKKDNPKIAYPGNLEPKKASFIYNLDEKKMNFELHVYGSGFNKTDNKKISYMGSFEPSILPTKFQSDLGLVWAGEMDESDENLIEKNYNKYNTPHKLSCFIAAGLPVIIWEKAAAADIVLKYNIGYTIKNIYDINNLNFDNYEEVKRNVEILSEKVRNGEFIKKAFIEAKKITL